MELHSPSHSYTHTHVMCGGIIGACDCIYAPSIAEPWDLIGLLFCTTAMPFTLQKYKGCGSLELGGKYLLHTRVMHAQLVTAQ